METNLARLCRLCLESSDDLVNIFDNFEGSTIASILTQHFWFQATKGDGFSESICEMCWINTKTFHNFYKRVEYRHAASTTPVVCYETIKQEADITLVKYEVTEVTTKEESDDYHDAASFERSEIAYDDHRSFNNIQENDVVGGDCDAHSNESSSIKRDKEDAQIREYFNMTCEVCRVPFETITLAKKHYRDAHNLRGYLTCCGKKFFRRGLALNHVAYHMNPDAFRCDVCGKQCANNRALENHIEYHHQPDLRAFICDLCPKSYSKAFRLAAHKRLHHVPDEDEKLPCDQCSKTFASQTKLRFHVRAVHPFSEPHICDICARVCKTKGILKNHMLVHSKVEKQKAQCNVCGVWLSHEEGLRNHLKRHEATTVNCSICDKVVKNRFAMRSHMQIVHGDSVHQCSVCDKKFKMAKSLKEHMSFHTGQDLYSCPYCSKTFRSGANMFSHRKKMHFAEWSRDGNKKRGIVEQTSTTKSK